MSKSSLLSKLCRVPLAIIIFLLTMSSAYAVTMDVTIGFNSVTKSNTWTPIAVDLSNPGGSAINGVLRIAQTDQTNGEASVCSVKVDLPPGSNKRYYAYAKLREYGSVVAALQSGINTIAYKKIDPAMLSPADNKIVVSIGSKASGLSFLQGEKVKQFIPGKQPETVINIGTIDKDKLPDRPSAYDCADVLVVSDLSSASVDPKCLKAIGMWVASGGTLVVGTGANYRSFQNRFFDEMLPVKITGAVNLPSLSSLSALGAVRFPQGQVAVAGSTPKSEICESVVMQSGVPVVATRRYGAGSVVFLAFDYLSSPFKDWNGQTAFWKYIIISANPSKIVTPSSQSWNMQNPSYAYQYQHNTGIWNDTLASVVESNPAVKAPSFAFIGSFLLLYLIVLVPGNYIVLKKRRQLEKAWFTTLGIVAVFSTLTYGVGYMMKGGHVQMQECSLITGTSGERYASVITDASIFSPARRSYDMQVDDPFALSQIMNMQGKAVNPDFYLGDSTDVENIRMSMWSSKTFESTSGIDLGGSIKSDILVSGDGISGSIRNGTGLNLKNCAVVFGLDKAKIPDMRRGADISVSSRLDSQVMAAIPAGDKKIDEKVIAFAEKAACRVGAPVLIAEVERDRQVFKLNKRGVQTQSVEFVLIKLNYRMGDDSVIFLPGSIKGKIIKSQGSLDTDVSQMPESMKNVKGAIVVHFYYDAYVISSFKLPSSTDGQISSLSLNSYVKEVQYGQGNNNKPVVNFSVYNYATGKWDPVVNGPGIRIKEPSKHIGQNNEVRVKAGMKPKSGGEAFVSFSISALAKGK
ncbi:MAG: DUF7408 domain-containing protein [Armatimonadota bacterium]